MRQIFLIVLFIQSIIHLSAQDIYKVNTKQIISPISPTLWGLFFEDINRGADGGLYAEMVENRSFDFPDPMMGWTEWPTERLRDGIFVINNQSAENPADPKFLSVNTIASDTVGLINQSFHGMYFKKGMDYFLTMRFRILSPDITLSILLLDGDNKPLASSVISLGGPNKDWTEVFTTIMPADSTTRGKLLLELEGAGKIDVDRISLMPCDSREHVFGLRPDLVQKLADLHPGFLRFPGGCIVEGNQLVNRYQWKHSIGDLQERWLTPSKWSEAIPERPTPDYFQSLGLGFYEYFELCEYIGAAPLPVINCGMSCQFDAAEVVPLSDLKPFIQDALDLIEFANGDSTTLWGEKRIKLGHPAPFNMKMLGVGNENWGPQYAERLSVFTSAIKANHPEIKLVNATGYSRMEPVFHYMDSVLRARHADIIDEHFYSSPEWFLKNATRYDSYDRRGPKIMVGEYAAQSVHAGSPKNSNNLKTALCEAAFMTGLERNADIVTMASYAPLFADTKDWQWTPDLIWFDNSRSYATPNYYVQQLFSINRGTDLVRLSLNNIPLTGQDSIWASATIDRNKKELILKLVNMSGQTKHKSISIADANPGSQINMTVLSNSDLNIRNSLDEPDSIKPAKTRFTISGKLIPLDLKPYSLSVVEIPVK